MSQNSHIGLTLYFMQDFLLYFGTQFSRFHEIKTRT